MKTKITTIIALLTLSATVFAQKQDSLSNTTISHSVGFNFGTTTGKGLAYQIGINKLSFQIAGHPLIQEQEKHYDVGLSAMYKFRDKKYVDLLTYIAANYIYNRDEGYQYGETKAPDIITKKTNMGAGLGFEFDTRNNISFKLLGGYGAYISEKSYEIAPSIETSVLYNF
ncbi:MAG: hypothetical protein ACO3EE_11570 [Flavobacteriales bacterium]